MGLVLVFCRCGWWLIMLIRIGFWVFFILMKNRCCFWCRCFLKGWKVWLVCCRLKKLFFYR